MNHSSKFLSLLTVFTIFSVFATEQECPRVQRENACWQSKHPICLYETSDHDGATNLGARGDILYMVYNVPALTYASEQSAIAEVFHSKVLNTQGHFSVGCNLALMYTMANQPGYSFESGWYHIVSKFSRKATADNILQAHIVSLSVARPGEASVNAHTAINFFDFLLKKSFSFGNWVSMTPTCGLVGGYINTKYRASSVASSGSFANPALPVVTTAFVSYVSKFEGIGLKLGGCGSFKLGCGFKLQGEFFYNALYGFANARLNYLQDAVFTPLGAGAAELSYNQHDVRTFFDSLLALAWETRFNNDTLFLDLHAGWRFQTFSDAWRQFEVETNDSVHDLSLSGQGLQAGATFKF